MALEAKPENEKPKGKLKKTLIATGSGAVAGFLGAMAFLRLANSGALGTLGESEEIAALVGIVYMFTGTALAIGLASPRFGARFLNVEDAEELIEQRRMLSWATAGMLALGLALIIAALAAPAGPIAAGLALALVLILIGFSCFTSLRQRHHTDELMKDLSRESTAIAFYLLFLIGGGWSLLAHTGFAPAPAPLDWLTLFAALLLAACFIAAGKRGMLAMR